MSGIPEHLLRRAAEAKAKALGRPVEDVLAEMMEEANAREAAVAVPAGDEPVEEAAPAAAAEAPAAETEPAEPEPIEEPHVAPVAEEPAAAAPPEAAAPPGLPVHLLRRSAEAKAKATGRPVEEILAEMGAAPAAAPAPAADAPTPAPPPEPEAPPAEPAPAAAPAAPSGLPEHLVRRSAEAKAKATGRPVEEILAEMGITSAPAEPAPAAPPPVEEPAVAPAAAAAAAAPAPGGNGAGNGEVWSLPGVPEHLIARSQAARAKAEGRPEPGAPAPAAAPAAAASSVATATATAPAPAAAPAIPEGVRTQRLLTVVKAGAIQKVKAEPSDKINVWPHLLAVEFVALLVVTALLTIFSVFVDAPLLELANFNEQPNPSKAPWYFLGLQELLSYFDPQIAGVLLPGLGLAGMAAIPYIDRNPSTRPADRKLAIMIFTFFMMSAALLTIWGSFYRGPGFNFTFPWNEGIFFDF